MYINIKYSPYSLKVLSTNLKPLPILKRHCYYTGLLSACDPIVPRMEHFEK